MSLKCFYIPGLFGQKEEANFLAPIFEELVVFDHLSFKSQELLDQLKNSLEEEAPDVIYAYSMGGRLLLSIYEELSFKPQRVYLESVGLEPLEGEARKERLLKDIVRSNGIKDNFKDFINHWYGLPLWQLSEEEKERMINEKVELQEHILLLSEIIVDFSPGHFPDQNFASFFDIFNQSEEMIYFAGEKDKKYLSLAQKLNSRTNTFPNCGHNIHFQAPEKLGEAIAQSLPIL